MSKNIKILFCLTLYIGTISSVTCVPCADESNGIMADEAVFRYRESLQQNKKHHLDLLREVMFMQLNHPDPEVRKNVAEVIGELDGPGRVDILRDIIDDEQIPLVQEAAVEGMCLSNDKSAVKYLLELLDDKNVFIRRKAANGLGHLGDKSILNVLDSAFSSEEDEFNRVMVALVMARLGDIEKLKLIESVLISHPRAEVRKYVATKLLSFNIILDEDVIEDAMQTERDENVRIRIACIQAYMGNQSRLFYIKDTLSKNKTTDIYFEAAQCLSELGELEYVYPFLLELLKEKDWRMRENVIEKLVEFGDFPLTDLFGEILLHDESYIVREIAAWALGERKDKAALPYLEKGLYDESAYVRTGVVAALYRILKAKGI